MSNYEYIVIGSGAGGGTIANTLARAGKKILILERGGFLPQEPENWSPEAVFQQGRYVSPDTWYDAGGKAFQPQSHYFVGGATKLYGAALFRLRPGDFRQLSHSSGISPAWPLTYSDFEPWYSAAEQLYQVHGEHGTDPTEGPWSAQYPHRPVSHAPRIRALASDLSAAGYHPFAAPSGVLLQQGGGCIRCNTCDGFPCQVAAKADAETIAVKPILELPNVTLLTNCTALRLTSNGQRVTGVVGQNSIGMEREFRADTVILSAGAANTAKILLASGIANSSGQVGRNFMMHNSRAVMAIDRKANATVFQKTLAVHDFYYMLGSIQMVGKSCAEAMKGESALAGMMPGWSLAKIAAHSIDFWLTTEDVPLPGNRVTLAPDGNIRLAYTPNDQLEADGLFRALKAMMNTMGVLNHHVLVGKSIPLAGVAHQAGTARMGTDPSASVVDVNCKAHDLANLYVVDASFMPSIGAVNPALTIMANALRIGQHLLER